jgi:hypothetical protein
VVYVHDEFNVLVTEPTVKGALKSIGWTKKNKESVRSITKNAFAVLAGRTYLSAHTQRFLQNLNASFTSHKGTRLYVAMSELMHLFLSLAMAFEEELGQLMPTSPNSQTTILSTEEDLASEFSRVSLRC